MTMQDIIQAMGLPESCRVDRRVPKKLLLENGALTAADKRLIVEAIDEIQWVAALKPNTIGVAAYRDDLREYLEIAVLTMTLRSTAGKATHVVRLAELVHRAVPYPVLLLLQAAQSLTLSLAHKRWAQNEAGKFVLDGGVVSVSPAADAPSASALTAFTQDLALTRQPRTTLLSLYQGWIDCVHALLAARWTGAFTVAGGEPLAAARRQALQDCERLEIEVARLRTQAAHENQIARQVALNLALKRVQAELTAAKERL